MVLKTWQPDDIDLMCDSCNKEITGDYNLVANKNNKASFEVFHLTALECAYAPEPIRMRARGKRGSKYRFES